MEQILTIKPRGDARAVTLTEGARAKVSELITAEGDTSLALRMGVRPGGCSGFSYEMFLDSDIGDGDTVEDFGGVRVVVDNESLTMVKGATLDYTDGLMGSGFAITNPNVTKSCGCGNSFS